MRWLYDFWISHTTSPLRLPVKQVREIQKESAPKRSNSLEELSLMEDQIPNAEFF